MSDSFSAFLADERIGPNGTVYAERPRDPAISARDNLALRAKSLEAGFASKIASRRTLAALPQGIVDDLKIDRRTLLDKKHFGSGLDASEKRQLALLSWKLDMVREAKYGVHTDRLRAAVQNYQKVAADIDLLKEELAASTMNRRGTNKHGGRRRTTA